ncbi:MAG TPA: sigma-70 family RNA polymerase sigma factor [Terriglobia bacterium]|nr:sigma-70 family RNA polymerase sigma factor [Terriglobia bacterium]
MAWASPEQITQLLVKWSQGDQTALAELMPVVYSELRRLARSHLRRERPDHTLQSAALVHEAYLRLAEQKNAHWKSRAHFFAVAAQLMRRILVDHARGHHAVKRGAGAIKLSLDAAMELPKELNLNLLRLDEALTSLSGLDPQQSRVVELRFFGGLSIRETAGVLGVSPTTVKREWTMARAWLYRELQTEAGRDA